MIYTIDAKNNVLLPVMKQYFNLDNVQIYNTINYEFNRMTNILKNKKINYSELKKALVPNQDKDKKELAFIFDSTLINSEWYGSYVFKKIIPLLSKESTFSILAGDYIDIINNQKKLKEIMFDCIDVKNVSSYQHSSQYFVVYFNSISQCQINTITASLQKEASFFGTIDLTYTSIIKTYLSNILCHVCIINKQKVIMAHEADRDDSENINLVGYPFEDNSFNVVSINEDLFIMFLSYKLESIMQDVEDINFSLNALCVDYSNLSDYSLLIDEDKFQYLNNDKKGIMESLGFDKITKDDMSGIIFQKISENYIYNLEYMDKYNVIKFNVCVELLTTSGHLRRTTIALEYKPNQKTLRLITLT